MKSAKNGKITNEQLLLSLDRLTRFKHTREKYPRVFSDIVNKYGEQNAKNLSVFELCATAEGIFNESTEGEPEEYFLNELINREEDESFFQDDESSKYLSTKLNIGAVLKFAGEDVPQNIKRLLVQNTNREITPKALREKYLLRYPIEKVVLCEGATEEILLEELAKCLGYDFNKHGVYPLGAGGKNQVARKYYQMIEEVRLPIFVLLDSDAKETEELIATKLRSIDKVYVINKGEFEDILPLNLVLRSLNSHFSNGFQCSEGDFNSEIQMSKNLKEIFRIKGFGDFKKSEFARSIKQNIKEDELNGEILQIVEQIQSL